MTAASSVSPSAAGRLPFLVATGLVLVAIGAAVLWGRSQLRAQFRSQLMGRDALILQALAARETAAVAGELPGAAGDPATHYAVLLGMAELTNIIAARLFDAEGGFVAAVPTRVKEASLGEATLAELRQLEPLARYRPAAPRHELFLYLPEVIEAPGDAVLSWVEVYVPLPGAGPGTLGGVAQFMLEGLTFEREFARLDRRLNRQSALVFFGGSLLVLLGLSWAFRRLARAHALLAARTADLQRANQALAEAARTTAVGAVTAHLIHSLKNPVAGLQSFVVSHQEDADAAGSEEWREALAATRRMQGLIQQVVQVLQDEQQAPAFTLSPAELAEVVLVQARPLATARGVRLEFAGSGEAVLDNRVAGLLRLMLANLLQNAIEATPPGGAVTLRFEGCPEALVAEVEDTGGGLPATVRARLFEPVQSRKEGGSGIGLAITRQLAGHLGAELTLVSSSAAGTVFRLRLPFPQKIA